MEFGYRRRMSTYHLQSVFRPQSVAVIGGSPRQRSAGRAVMRNLRGTGFPARWRGSTRGMPKSMASAP